MLYECLTGEVPFRASNYLGVISQVLTQETTPPSQLRPELSIPVAVDRVVMRGACEGPRQALPAHGPTSSMISSDWLAGDSTVALRDVPSPSEAPAEHPLRWPLAALGVLALGAAIAGGAGGPRSASAGSRGARATEAGAASGAPRGFACGPPASGSAGTGALDA